MAIFISKFIEFTPEQKEHAASVDLEEFLLRQGEKLIKSGREKRLASDHSVTVRGCEWFDHASNEGGRAVSFVQKYYGKSYVEAMSMLLGESMEPVYPQAKKQEPTEQKPFAPPVPNANMHRVFAYLLKTRGLDADVVSYFARKKMLYEDAAHHNVVFIGTDEGGCPRHAHLRSTNSFGKAFRLNVESSDPRYSFHHTGTDGSLYVFEAPIDMLSYWQEGLAAAGIPQEKLPELFEPGTALAAKLLPDVREKLGFREDTLVVTGAMDQTAGALGAGNLRPGCVTETTGTALCIGAALEEPNLNDPNRVTIYRHVKPGLFLMLPFCMTAGLFLKWFKDTFCEAECRQAEQEHRSVYELLDELAEQTPPGAGGLLALPYLTGSIQPCSNPNARGVFFGIGLDTKKRHFLRAVYESVAFMLRENLELLMRVNHMQITQIRSLGGGAKSAAWRQIKADVTGIPVGLAAQSESTSLGAAMLAAVASGGMPSLECAVKTADRGVIWTRPSGAGSYEQAYRKYCELFRPLNPLF